MEKKFSFFFRKKLYLGPACVFWGGLRISSVFLEKKCKNLAKMAKRADPRAGHTTVPQTTTERRGGRPTMANRDQLTE